MLARKFFFNCNVTPKIQQWNLIYKYECLVRIQGFDWSNNVTTILKLIQNLWRFKETGYFRQTHLLQTLDLQQRQFPDFHIYSVSLTSLEEQTIFV